MTTVPTPSSQTRGDLSDRLNRPLSIGGRTLPNRLLLAPLTLLGHVAFRELLAGFGGCGLMFSEMCSAKGIPQENRRVSPYFRWRDPEREMLSIQILGADPETMAGAARRIASEGLFGVDINFGCAVSTVCKGGGGAALLKAPDRAQAIVSAVRKAVSIPVTVKFRIGWHNGRNRPAALARRFEEAGADALTFHPRLAPDRRSRPPAWETIAAVKSAVSIPVFGNGNVFTPEDCLKMLRETGCDGVAVGRMAVVRPWLFAAWTRGYEPGSDIYGSTALKLIGLLEKHYEPSRALGRFKKFAFYYAANFRFGHQLFSAIQNAGDMDSVRAAVQQFFSSAPEVTERPNMNFMT